MNINRETDALIIVDFQNDFITGSLAVPNATEIAVPILEFSNEFDTIVASQDWHPADHSSFKLWPEHCVQNTYGAKLHERVARNPRVSMIIRKGADKDADSYSAFMEFPDAQGWRKESGLAGFLFSRQIRRTYFVGLARDFCVLSSALDADGLDPHFVWDLTRPVHENSDESTLAQLNEKRIKVV